MRLLASACASLILAAPVVAHADEPMTPVSDAPPDAPRVRQDPGLFAAGLTSAIAGGVALNAGAIIVLLGKSDCVGNCGGERWTEDEKLMTTGVITLALAGLLIVTGIPMAIVGGRKVPATPRSMQGAGLVPMWTF